MHAFRKFMAHKFPIRQALLIIGSSLLVAFAANQVSESAGLSPTAVTGIGLVAAVATFIPLQIVFYRRAHA